MMRAILMLGLLALAAVAGPRGAAAEEVDLELVLMADATGSIDEAEIRFQREGYATAITSAEVLSTIAETGRGRIGLTYVEWADAMSQDVVVPWRIVDGPESAAAFAEALRAAPRRAYGRNAIGAALLAGKRMIEENDLVGLRRVIDLSADSANNWSGPSIAEARAAVLDAGITINGLAVLCRGCSGRPVDYDLEREFERAIIGGPGSFVITADSAETFADAVRRKMVLEIAGGPVPEGRLAARP